MITSHACTAQVAGTALAPRPVDGGSLTLDESWSPYVQGSLTFTLDATTADAIDPRADARMLVRCSAQFGEPFTLAEITSGAGSTTAAWTADLAGAPLAAWTGEHGRPYNAFGMRASRARRFDLGVRDRVVDHQAGTITVQLASDEALLQDVALVATAPRSPASATVRAAVTLALSEIGAVLEPGVDDGPVEPDAAAWQPGETGWDYVRPLVDSAGLRLFCDEQRRWHLVQPLAPTGGALMLSPTNTMQLQDQIARDVGWYDAVVVVYRWRDSSGVDRTVYDVATTPGYTKVRTVEIARPWPGNGAARAMLARSSGRGRVLAATGVSDYGAEPGQMLLISSPAAPLQTGLLARVTWDLAAREMQVRSRDLIDTPTRSWITWPPSWPTWTSIPAGQTWDTLTYPTTPEG